MLLYCSLLIKKYFHFIVFYFCYWTMLSGAQGLFLALHSGITHGRLGDFMGCQILNWVSCLQTNALPTVLLLQTLIKKKLLKILDSYHTGGEFFFNIY